MSPSNSLSEPPRTSSSPTGIFNSTRTRSDLSRSIVGASCCSGPTEIRLPPQPASVMAAKHKSCLCISPSLLKKPAQQFDALHRQYPFHDFYPMIQQFGIRHPKLAAHSAEPEIPCPEHDPGHPRVHQRP